MLATSSIVLAGLGAAPAAFADGEPTTSSTVEYIVADSTDNPADNDSWYEQAYENFDTGGYLTTQQTEVTGPQRAPFGPGSHRMVIGESSAQTELYRTNAYDGVDLSDLTRLEYSSFARSTSGGADRQPTYLRLSVDNDGTDGTDATETSLFFYPANNGPVVNGEWQNWDVANGDINVDGDGGATTTLAAYSAANPEAVLVNDKFEETHDAGAVALVTGGALGGSGDPQINGEYFVDRVIVGEQDADTLYDLGVHTETLGATTQKTVDPDNMQGWQHQAYDDVVYLNSNQQFVRGPETPPAGIGSLKFALSDDTNPDRVELFRTTQYDGTKVRDLRTIEFSTYQQVTGGNVTPQQPVYMRLSVDTDGDGATDDSLFFYPGNNGVVAQSDWQTWDAGTGVWGVNGDQGPFDSVTLEQYLVAHPDAAIVENADPSAPLQPHGGVAFLVGGAGSDIQLNGEYFLDDITITKVDNAAGSTESGTEFDLEPVHVSPAISIGNDRVLEGNNGAMLEFPVTLDQAADDDVTVSYATSNGTAKAGKDYVAKSGSVTVPAGQTSATITVKVLSDKVRESNERMTVTLSGPTVGTLADASARGTIVNDDTRVGLALGQTDARRIRATVDTLPDAPGATVKVYRVVKGGTVRVLNAELNRLGRISRVLEKQYVSGRKVTFFATVRTAHGLYRSVNVSRVIN